MKRNDINSRLDQEITYLKEAHQNSIKLVAEVKKFLRYFNHEDIETVEDISVNVKPHLSFSIGILFKTKKQLIIDFEYSPDFPDIIVIGWNLYSLYLNDYDNGYIDNLAVDIEKIKKLIASTEQESDTHD